MPLVRYFVIAGSALLPLLFLLDWYLPQSVVDPARASADHAAIRIQSGHKWPSAIAFDTNQPTIVPPAAEVALDAPVRKPPREALAMVQQPAPVVHPAPPAAKPKRVTRRVKPAQPPAEQVASYDMFGFRNSFPAR